MSRARVWRQPQVPVSRAVMTPAVADEVSFLFRVSELGGTTPKFDCTLESGEEIRIKYGSGPEVPAEAAATRLLRALGFGADEITLVKKLRCFGCPIEPFSMMRAVDITNAESFYTSFVDYDAFEEFEWVALERKLNARPIESDAIEGWAFFELETIEPNRGGAPRAHVDALRVMAVLLAHWDNKSENQRLVCLSREWPDGAACGTPFVLLQDVGATFGPSKLDLEAWEATPMWADRGACTMSMRGLPFGGATYGDVTISERGRQFISSLLSALSDDQLTALFTGARFGETRGLFAPVHPVSEWVRVFRIKVREIRDGPRCPQA
jgi:hypothetical protein